MEKSGIVFFKTQQLDVLKEFYCSQVGCSVWMDQGDCCILQHGDFLFGFCMRDRTDKCGILTFVYASDAAVNGCYQRLKGIATDKPQQNPKYPIYHFFATDPDGRAIEFQHFQ